MKPARPARLIQLCDNYGMDSISLGVTLSYTLSYNERAPGKTVAQWRPVRRL